MPYCDVLISSRSWYSVFPSLDKTISCRIKKAFVGVTQLLPKVSALPVSWNIVSQHLPIMWIKPIIQSTGKRLRSSTENKTVLLGGSRKPYISTRKVIELWIETRAVISWVTPTTAFLMRLLIVASKLRKTEYQLLLMKISWWDQHVKIRYYCFGCDLWIFLLILTHCVLLMVIYRQMLLHLWINHCF